MEKHKVIKPFFKLSDKKNYNIGDTVELEKELVKTYAENGYIEKPKTKK